MKNYHTHTYRCMHASGTEEEYILSALDAGYTTLGFSDHTPWHYHSSFVAGMRMKDTELEDYITTINALKEKYQGKIRILTGLECEYFPEYMPWLKEMIEKYHINYIILGNHYLKSDEVGQYVGYDCDETALTQYVDYCIEALKTGLYSYIAHPDLPNYLDLESEFYNQEMTRLCQVCKELDIPVEFNLLGFAAKRNYPNDTFFNIAKKVGNKAIIGVDAHSAAALATTSVYDKAYQYLTDMGFEIVDEIKLLNEDIND